MMTDNDIRYKELLFNPSEWMKNKKLAKLREELKELGENIMHEKYLKYEIILRKKWDEKVSEFLTIYDNEYRN